MPRASEYLLPGHTYHLTHRCHDRQFLLRFARERRVYREWLRKERTGSMWQHPYHCPAVEDGRHLLHCLAYVDLNMVRAGVVPYSEHWQWCGFDEMAGLRRRYRVLDLEGLAEDVGSTCQDPWAVREAVFPYAAQSEPKNRP